MLATHFSNHKTKYIGFLIMALLTISVTHFVTRSEAQGLPFGFSETDIQNFEQTQVNCPPFLRYRIIHSPLFIHPCMRLPVNQAPIVSDTQMTQTPVVIEASSTLEVATSTDETTETSTTTTATSTEEVLQGNATTSESSNESAPVTQ